MAQIVYLPKHRLYQALGISYLAGQNYLLKGILVPDALIQDGQTLNPIFRSERLGELRQAVASFRGSRGSKVKKPLPSVRLRT